MRFAVGSLALIAEATASEVAVGQPNGAILGVITKIKSKVSTLIDEVKDEIEKEKDIHAKFECYCDKSGTEVSAATAQAAENIERLQGEIKKSKGLAETLGNEITELKNSRASDEKTLEATITDCAEAKAAYEKDFAEEEQEAEMMRKAIKVLSENIPSGRGFLQTASGVHLKELLTKESSFLDRVDVGSQSVLASFLESGATSAGSTEEIIGILKQMLDDLVKATNGAVAEEEKRRENCKAEQKNLRERIAMATKKIDSKNEKKTEAAVDAVTKQGEVTKLEGTMAADQKFAAQLEKDCKSSGETFAQNQEDSHNELNALQDAHTYMNGGQILADLGIAPGAGTEAPVEVPVFLQMSEGDIRGAKAMDILRTDSKSSAKLSMLSQKLQAGFDFSVVIKMIDDMVALMKEEAKTDLESRDECNATLNTLASDIKDSSNEMKQVNADIEDLTAQIEQLSTDIAKYNEDLVAAKDRMAKATAARREATKDFETLMHEQNLGKQVIDTLIQKLAPQFNPSLVTTTEAPPQSAEDQIAQAAGFTLLQQSQRPATVQKREGNQNKGGGIITMLQNLGADIQRKMADAEKEEAIQQASYEAESKNIADIVVSSREGKQDAEGTKAGKAEELADAKDKQSTTERALDALNKANFDKKQSCEFILTNFDARKEARAQEADSLQKAKAVLSGANFS